MKRFSCFAFISTVVALASCFPIQAQPKDPPKTFINSIGMKFVWIPPGTFVMGSPKEEKHRDANELHHNFTLTKGFYLGVYLVTQEQCRLVEQDSAPAPMRSAMRRNGLLPVRGGRYLSTAARGV